MSQRHMYHNMHSCDDTFLINLPHLSLSLLDESTFYLSMNLSYITRHPHVWWHFWKYCPTDNLTIQQKSHKPMIDKYITKFLKFKLLPRQSGPRNQGLYSLSGWTSYRKISWSLEATRFGFRLFQSLWNLTGTSAAVLPRCPSNFRAIL